MTLVDGVMNSIWTGEPKDTIRDILRGIRRLAWPVRLFMVGNMVKVDQGKSVNMVEWEQMYWDQ